MRIVDLEVRDFRNLESVRVQCSPGFTALVGDNGQGKTNTLEAMYFVAALRPLRNVQRKVLLRQGCTEARIRLSVHQQRTRLTHRLGVDFASGRRQLWKDDKKVDTQAFLGTLVAVAFTPDDLSVSKGGPDGRRRFLDRAILNHHPAYLGHALRYGRALKDRNRLLSDGASDAMLDAYDDVVAAEGAEIAVRRRRFVDEVAVLIQQRFGHIADPAPALSVELVSTLGDRLDPDSVARTREGLLAELARRRPRDRARRKTTVGPHLDDLDLRLDGQPARERASQGQHRALALALKLAELHHLTERLTEPPVLLLDDMSSELDQVRSQNLFASVREFEGQVILTSTNSIEEVRRTLDHPSDLVAYRVEGGGLDPMAGPGGAGVSS